MNADWIQRIADTARPALTEPGAVIVALSWADSSYWLATRLYNADDYSDSRALRKVVWGRITRLLNEDTAGVNLYAVHRYSDGTLVVYNGPDSIMLTEEPRLRAVAALDAEIAAQQEFDRSRRVSQAATLCL
jgi:hypothetical protein